ncbi:hypothetical protein [Moorena bouillonii]|uniref:hypothetical protein n=1 Tax=Moorena bouillonii TaxID=207920 RepID=UPI0013017369|nr:hypothetical protein [Moorena bouillonii]NEO50474.1 hypothetical protein [Moorena sp. SIO4A3]
MNSSYVSIQLSAISYQLKALGHATVHAAPQVAQSVLLKQISTSSNVSQKLTAVCVACA